MASVPPPIPEVFILDEQKLQSAESSDKQELYLLQWLAQVERECKTIDPDILKRAQPPLESTLLRLISLSTAKPRRPIRFLIGRCFVILYTRGETRNLFDTVTSLHTLINATKNTEKEARIAAVSTTGAIMGATGSKVLSLFAETAAHLTKVIKSSNNPLLLRLEAINAFTLLLKGAGKAATESILKELTKHLKHGLVDKALVMRVACAQCMQAVIQHAKQTFTQHDVENLLQIFLKAFEGSTFPVRRAVSSLCATLLAFTQTTATTDPNKPNIKYASTGEDSARNNADIIIQPNSTLLSVDDMLNLLSTYYNRPNMSREFKIGIIETYATLFVLLGTEFVESNYPTIARHILKELLDGTKQNLIAADGSFARAQVFFLLHSTIGKRLLSEHGQAMAIRHLIAEWIKSWPPLKRHQSPPNKHALICATNLISALVCELGGGANVVKDIVVDPLFVLLTHPSFSVQTAAAWCIRCVCFSVPSNLPYLLPRALNTLEKDLSNLNNPTTTPELLRRVIAYAYTVGAIMSVFPARPIYTSFELSARAMSLATQLLKTPSKASHIAGIQVQVAWILVGSLMCLGANLVKLHLPQLLLLWKSALPKPTGKEANAIRAEVEWSYLFHIRECAISSIYSFLVHNSTTLVTLDVAKRIAALLNNTLAFLATAPNSFSSATISPCVPHQTRLVDQYYMLRRRIFQCFVTIRPLLSTYESSLTSLLRNSLNVFIELDKIQPSSGAHAQVTASVPGQFISVWSTADGHGYGVTSKMQGYRTDVAKEYDDDHGEDGNGDNSHGKEWVTKDRFQRIEELLERPIIGSVELDPIYIYTTFASTAEGNESLILPRPVSPSTGYIDTSIELFATLFPSQPPPVQESTFEHIASVVKDARLEKNSPKRAAVLVNVTVALLGAFKNMMSPANKKKTTHGLASGRATQLVQEILMEAIVHPDPYLRNAASETIGRLTAIVGGSFVAGQMQQLVDLVVSNRDPDVRAGCALAIGYIYTHVGGMAAAPHLKTLFGILVSLSSDPHPVVHAWALEAIAMTVSAAGLMFSSYVNSTLGMVAKLYLSETHEPGSGSVAVSNAGMSVGFSAYQEFGRIIYELIGTLGPELQASSKIRELCLNMVEELKLEPDERVNVEAIRCIQHFLMFAPQHINTQELVPYLQGQIVSLHLPLKKAAVTCLYQLVQRDAELVFKAAQPGLDTELFKMLDTDPGLSDVKNVIKSWLKETALHEPSVWVNITKRILSGTNKPDGKTGAGGAASTTTSAAEDLSVSAGSGNRGGSFDGPSFDGDGDGDGFDDDGFGDDEGAGFGDDEQQVDITTSVADASGMTSRLTVNVEIPPRWRTQLFALQCLQRTIEIISSSGTREHFDLIYARARRQQAGFGDYLVFRVPDLIKLSFTAATAHVDELRLAGISLLRMVIEKFASTADPDLEGTLLLEQYAAQIGAALTPAFGADSSSEIVSAAVRVCAIYVGSGIVKDLYQLGRVLKLLVSSLDKVKSESELTGVGEVKDLSPHASVMVKLSVLNAWAELQVASQRQDYLRQILQPNLSALSPLWLRSLQDYARIRLESDIVALTSSAEGIQTSSSGGIESMYSAATKQVVLPYYRKSWLKIMEAVASLIESNAPSMLDALANNPDTEQTEPDKPSNLFCILFGLCIESLSRISSSSSGRSDVSTMAICLKALKTFIQPSLAGDHFLPKAIFLELMNVFDRLIQTEGYRVQLIIIEIIQRLTKNYGANYLCDDLADQSSHDDLDSLRGTVLEDMDRALEPNAFPSTAKLYYVLRLLINVFLQTLPSLSATKRSSSRLAGTNQEHVAILLGPCLEELGMLVNIAPASYKVDLLAICFYIFSEILKDSKLDTLLAPRVLVSLKSTLPQLELSLEATEKRTLSRVNCSMLHSLLDDLFKKDTQEINESMLKNKLLASVLIVTGCPEASIHDTEGRNVFVNTMKQALQSETKEIALTAHQCMRMLVMLPEKKSDSPVSVSLGKSLLSALIPAIVQRLLSFQELSTTISEDQLALLNEDVKTLITLPTAVHDDKEKSLLLSIVLPTLTTLLDPVSTTQENTAVHRTVITQILTLATNMPPAFKDTVSQLPDHVRNQLETSVRQSVLSSQQQQQQQQQKIKRQQEELQRHEDIKQPTIHLKTDFSNFS